MWATAACLGLLREAGITLLSVAHRPSVEQFHKRKMTMRAMEGVEGVSVEMTAVGGGALGRLW